MLAIVCNHAASDRDLCECAPLDEPDNCGCKPAAGAQLEDGMPCAACGAPCDVFEGAGADDKTMSELVDHIVKQVAKAHPLQGRQATVGFRAVIQPGEVRQISIEVETTFRAEKLVLAQPPQSRVQRFLAYSWYVPLSLVMTIGVAMRKVTDRGKWLKWVSWRAPWPGPPVEVVNVRVDARDQFIRESHLPSEIFTVDAAQSPYLGMDVVHAGRKLTLVVRSIAEEPYELKGYFLGTAFV